MLDGNKPYPWSHDDVIQLDQNVEEYRFIHITEVNKNNYISDMISPMCMRTPSWISTFMV